MRDWLCWDRFSDIPITEIEADNHEEAMEKFEEMYAHDKPWAICREA